jgi:hypothetical protein
LRYLAKRCPGRRLSGDRYRWDHVLSRRRRVWVARPIEGRCEPRRIDVGEADSISFSVSGLARAPAVVNLKKDQLLYKRRSLRFRDPIQTLFNPGPRGALQGGLAGGFERTTYPVEVLVPGERL